jgi:hypothetical protein
LKRGGNGSIDDQPRRPRVAKKFGTSNALVTAIRLTLIGQGSLAKIRIASGSTPSSA